MGTDVGYLRVEVAIETEVSWSVVAILGILRSGKIRLGSKNLLSVIKQMLKYLMQGTYGITIK